jgi:4-hydroxyphenylacetate 3-monooxygenase
MTRASSPSASDFFNGLLGNEMFYAGAPFVTCAHSYRTYDWPAADALVRKMLA